MGSKVNANAEAEGSKNQKNEWAFTETKANEYCFNLDANDPSIGSPTETLLRLLLPLSDRVYKTFHPRLKVGSCAV